MTVPDPLTDRRAEVLAALLCGALLGAASHRIDSFPAELEELAREYFTLFPPAAKA